MAGLWGALACGRAPDSLGRPLLRFLASVASSAPSSEDGISPGCLRMPEDPHRRLDLEIDFEDPDSQSERPADGITTWDPGRIEWSRGTMS
jgi:hypothetical protein